MPEHGSWPGTDEELERAFREDFLRLQELEVPILLNGVGAWVLLVQVQLALRHPGNHGPTSDRARELAEELERAITFTPALTEVARRGWIAGYDVPSQWT